MDMYVVVFSVAFLTFLIILFNLLHLVEVDEASNPDNIWFGTPSATILPSKRRQDGDEASPHEETRPRQDKEDRKRRRVEAKRQKSKPMVVDEKMEVSEPKAPLAAVSVQNDVPQVPENPSPPPTTISRTSPHEEQVSGGSVDIQAGFRVEGVSMGSFIL